MNTPSVTAFSATGTKFSSVDKAYHLLRYTYALVPIVAGVDKFTHLLTNWNNYLAPAVRDLLPFSPDVFMYVVGVIEILAGVLVIIRPRLGALVVGLWLLGITLNLFLTGQYFDVAVRDAVMAVGAFSLFFLSESKGERLV
ncbi:DoxX family membrane protein [Rufibacter psychrotolerans]|uniref:DoxX family membrane protein n=1 Tax=Rufibacter psychrotolerans TaxID=2812556 RepID=UPI0019682D43|nr:DoxX family membrane protein [Rufibacter sp. SYSU D00308]